MAMRSPRIARIAAPSSLSRSCPSNSTSPDSMRPGGSGIRRSSESAVTLLPDPLSPTMASVSPAARSRDSPSTARTLPRGERKETDRSRTLRSGAAKGSVAHLLLHLLVDPDAGVDRARALGADAQLALVVLHPRPPGAVDVGDWQPDIGRLVEDLDREDLEHALARCLVLGA